ncbi:MAG: hypothetical protein WHT07_01495 [Desulfobaccales bacterium]
MDAGEVPKIADPLILERLGDSPGQRQPGEQRPRSPGRRRPGHEDPGEIPASGQEGKVDIRA